MSDAAKVFPTPVEVIISDPDKTEDGDTLTVVIRPMKVGQLPEILKACRNLGMLFSNPENVDPKLVFMDHTDSVLDLLALALKWERKRVDQLEIDDAVKLFVATLEANIDFFINRVLPSVLAVMARVNGHLKAPVVPSAGPTPSTTSSPEATPSLP